MLETTYVGSFPLKYSRSNIIRVLEDVARIGIDYPCYPQLTDFIEQFLNPFSRMNIGIELKGGEYWFSSKLEMLSGKFELEALDLTVKFNKERKVFKGIRACVTGPFTLASKIRISSEKRGFYGTLLSMPSEVNRLAEIVAKIALDFYQTGATWINVDEPVLSILVGRKRILLNYTMDDIIKILNTTVKYLGKEIIKGIHVCGRLSPLLAEILLSSNFKVLDHEFYDTPDNLKVYNKRTLEENDKLISFGCVSSKNATIEDFQAVRKLVEEGIKVFGDKLKYLKPDCGFRGLGISEKNYQISLSKLNIVRQITDYFNKYIND